MVNLSKIQNAVACRECRAHISPKAPACPHCGARQTNGTEKNRVVAALLAFFLGGIGIHRFYLGRSVSGVLYLLFCWTFIPGFLGLIETVRLLLMSDDKFLRKYS
ncbi:NINE protein [Sphingomonas sp. 3-13AW]|uniref:NINE protein n=1 Tax=Sphingomonas sp. 3-13AW TaxID=3050450 RepID=UPI003BB577F9